MGGGCWCGGGRRLRRRREWRGGRWLGAMGLFVRVGVLVCVGAGFGGVLTRRNVHGI